MWENRLSVGEEGVFEFSLIPSSISLKVGPRCDRALYIAYLNLGCPNVSHWSRQADATF